MILKRHKFCSAFDLTMNAPAVLSTKRRVLEFEIFDGTDRWAVTTGALLCTPEAQGFYSVYRVKGLTSEGQPMCRRVYDCKFQSWDFQEWTCYGPEVYRFPEYGKFILDKHQCSVFFPPLYYITINVEVRPEELVILRKVVSDLRPSGPSIHFNEVVFKTGAGVSFTLASSRESARSDFEALFILDMVKHLVDSTVYDKESFMSYQSGLKHLQPLKRIQCPFCAECFGCTGDRRVHYQTSCRGKHLQLAANASDFVSDARALLCTLLKSHLQRTSKSTDSICITGTFPRIYWEALFGTDSFLPASYTYKFELYSLQDLLKVIVHLSHAVYRSPQKKNMLSFLKRGEPCPAKLKLFQFEESWKISASFAVSH